MAGPRLVNHPLNPRLAPTVEALTTRFPQYVETSIDPMAWVLVQPQPGACPIHILDLDQEFILAVGRGNCRWELEFTAEHISFCESIVKAVIDGQVREVFAPGRSHIEVQFDDGTIARTTTHRTPEGCLPIPFWKRRTSRTVAYVPYP